MGGLTRPVIWAGILATLGAPSVFTSAASQPAAASDPWKLVHPDAKWILGVDWTRARNSEAARVLARHLRSAEGRLEAAGLGLQAVTSVSRIIASGPSLAPADSARAQHVVVAIEGSIDRVRLKQGLPAGTAIERFRGADLFVPPNAGPDEPLLAIQGNRLLIADRSSLGLILEGKGGLRDAALYGRAARLATESDVWFVMSDPAHSQKPPSGPGLLPGVRDIDLLVSLQRGLRIQGTVTAADPMEIRRLAGVLRSAGAMSSPELTAWLSRLQITARGGQLAFRLDIPAAELEEGLDMAKRAARQFGRQSLASLVSAPADVDGPSAKTDPAAGAAHAVSMSRPASPPEVRTIRIVGLEEGTKEIQYTPPSGGRP